VVRAHKGPVKYKKRVLGAKCMVLETGAATLADWRAKLDGDQSCLAGALQNFLLAYRGEGIARSKM